MEKCSSRLHIYMAKALNTAQGQAVNKEANMWYFDTIEEVQLQGDDGKPIAPECTYTMDKIGFQANGNEGFEKVIGATGKKLQYQQQAGTRDNTTSPLQINFPIINFQSLILSAYLILSRIILMFGSIYNIIRFKDTHSTHV